MKKFLAILLALTLVFSLTACGDNDSDDRSDREKTKKTTVEETEEPEETTVKKTEETTVATETTEEAKTSSSLTVTMPAGWEQNKQSTSLFQYQKGVSTFIIVKDSTATQMSLTELADTYMDVLSSTFDNVVQTGAPETYVMNGIDAIRFSFTANIGFDMQFTYFIFAVDSQIYIGTVGTTVSEYANMEADFEQIVTSAVSVAK